MASEERKKYQEVLAQLIGGRVVAYRPILAKWVGGVKPAVMLSQLLYWHGDKDTEKKNGWFYKTIVEMEEETGLTKAEQQTAREKLKLTGIVEIKQKGVPPIWHYKVSLESLGAFLIGRVSRPMENPSNGKPVDQRTGNPPNNGSDSRPSKDGVSAHLNNELKITSSRLPSKITSSSSRNGKDYPQAKEEEETQVIFSEDILEALNDIGVYKGLHSEISLACLPDEELLAMVEKAQADEPEYGKTAALFMYRLRNRPEPGRQETPEEREARQRRERYGKWATSLDEEETDS